MESLNFRAKNGYHDYDDYGFRNGNVLNWNDFCLEIGQKSERTEDRKTVVEGTALIVPLSETSICTF